MLQAIRSFMRTLLLRFLLPLLVIGLTAGCDDNEGLAPLDPDEPITLKVIYYNQAELYNAFGGLFLMKYPHIQLEVVEMNNVFNSTEKYYDILDEVIAKQNPDLLLLNPYSYSVLAAEGRLLPLASFIHADRFDLKPLAAPVTDILRARGGGQLYGLAPQFTSRALFYNQDLFRQNGIPYPTDRMSWEEVLQLARRFPSGNDVYGLSYLNNLSPFYLFDSMLQTHQLVPIHPLQQKVVVDTPAWSVLLQQAVDAYQAGAVRPPGPIQTGPMDSASSLRSHPFIAGKLAMSVNNFSLLRDLDQAERLLSGGVPAWDLVTAPVQPSSRNQSSHYSLHGVFAISAQSGSQRAAWELLKFIHGPEYARMLTATSRGILPARLDVLRPSGERNDKAFWTLSAADTGSAPLPITLQDRFWSMARPELEAAFNGKQSVADTLRVLQEKGEAWLQEEIRAGAFN